MRHPISQLRVIQFYSRKSPLGSSTFYHCLLHHFLMSYESFGLENLPLKSPNFLPISLFIGIRFMMLCIGYVIIMMTITMSQSMKIDGQVRVHGGSDRVIGLHGICH